MKIRIGLLPKALGMLGVVMATTAVAQNVGPSPTNNIPFPADYKDWQVISVSERTDNNTLRVIIGNDIAMAAIRAGNTTPYPDGAIIGKVVWSQENHANWEAAVVPKEFRAAEFMIKDSAQFADFGGWGFARWLTTDLNPCGADPCQPQVCFDCHTPVQASDYVFTKPVLMP